MKRKLFVALMCLAAVAAVTSVSCVNKAAPGKIGKGKPITISIFTS
jgi:hypothetical protein